jgi:hypothetical protein
MKSIAFSVLFQRHSVDHVRKREVDFKEKNFKINYVILKHCELSKLCQFSLLYICTVPYPVANNTFA